ADRRRNDPAQRRRKPVRPAAGADLRERQRQDLHRIRQAVVPVRTVWAPAGGRGGRITRQEAGTTGGHGHALTVRDETVTASFGGGRCQPCCCRIPRLTPADSCIRNYRGHEEGALAWIKGAAVSIPSHATASRSAFAS